MSLLLLFKCYDVIILTVSSQVASVNKETQISANFSNGQFKAAHIFKATASIFSVVSAVWKEIVKGTTFLGKKTKNIH